MRNFRQQALGSLITRLVWRFLRSYSESTAKERGWPIAKVDLEVVTAFSILAGLFERVLFTLLVAFEVPGTAVGLMLWVAAKMAAGWNRFPGEEEKEAAHRMFAFSGLLSSVTSLTFAVLGGLISNGRIPIFKLF